MLTRRIVKTFWDEVVHALELCLVWPDPGSRCLQPRLSHGFWRCWKKRLWNSRRWFAKFESCSPTSMWSCWRNCVLCLKQRKSIWIPKNWCMCSLRQWESLQEKCLVVKVLTHGLVSKWESTSDSLAHTALLRLLSRLLPSVLSQAFKSLLQMPKSTILINWLNQLLKTKIVKVMLKPVLWVYLLVWSKQCLPFPAADLIALEKCESCR